MQKLNSLLFLIQKEKMPHSSLDKKSTQEIEIGPETLKDKKILVVDDENQIAKLASRMLENFGAKTKRAFSGEEALRILKEGYLPDLIITDHDMPGGINGSQFKQKKDEFLPGVPVVMMSGATTKKDVEGIGFKAVMKKPFALKELTETTAGILLQEKKNMINANDNPSSQNRPTEISPDLKKKIDPELKAACVNCYEIVRMGLENLLSKLGYEIAQKPEEEGVKLIITGNSLGDALTEVKRIKEINPEVCTIRATGGGVPVEGIEVFDYTYISGQELTQGIISTATKIKKEAFATIN